MVQKLNDTQSDVENRVTQQESTMAEIHKQVEELVSVKDSVPMKSEGVSEETLQKELQSLKEDLRGWTGITITKRLESVATKHAQSVSKEKSAESPGTGESNQPSLARPSDHLTPAQSSSPLNQSTSEGVTSNSSTNDSTLSVSQAFLGRHSPFHRLKIGDPKRQEYFPFIVLQPDRITSLAQLQALQGVVEDKLEEGPLFKEYFDRIQVEILSESDKKDKLSSNQLKPSVVKLTKCRTASTDPSKPHELETFVANMKLLANNHYPLREWSRELFSALTLFTQECLGEIREPLRTDVKSSPINLYAFLRFCRYTEADLLGVYYSKLPALTSASSSASQDLFHSAEELARTFGVYSFESLQTYLCTVVPDPATHHLIRQAGSRLELHKIVYAMSATLPARTMSIIPETPSEIRYRELDELSMTECDQITRCLLVDNAPYTLQCWECNGKGHGLMACPQLKSWSRQQKLERIKQLRTMGKAPRRSKWQPAADSTRQDQALV